MDRRAFFKTLGLAVAAWFGAMRASAEEKDGAANSSPEFERLEKPLSEWRKILEPRRYGVLFKEKTEPPFSDVNSRKTTSRNSRS